MISILKSYLGMGIPTTAEVTTGEGASPNKVVFRFIPKDGNMTVKRHKSPPK